MKPSLSDEAIVNEVSFFDIPDLINMGMKEASPDDFAIINQHFQEARQRGDLPVLLAWPDGCFSVCALKSSIPNVPLFMPDPRSIIRAYWSSRQAREVH